MKKTFVILLMLLVAQGWSGMNPYECKKVAKAILNLQNAIVEKAYQRLSPGAWAAYSNGTKAIYVGKTDRDGQTLYGIDMRNPNMQIWYRIVPKTFHVQGHTYTMLTLDPYDLYLQTRSGVWHVPHDTLETFVATFYGKHLSIILTPAEVWLPLCCRYEVEVRKISYKLPNQSSIKATRIRSLQNGGWVTASPDVPFGFIESGNPEEGRGLHLIDFGLSGFKPLVDENARKMAQPLPMGPFMPKGAPMPTGPVLPGVVK